MVDLVGFLIRGYSPTSIKGKWLGFPNLYTLLTLLIKHIIRKLLELYSDITMSCREWTIRLANTGLRTRAVASGVSGIRAVAIGVRTRVRTRAVARQGQ